MKVYRTMACGKRVPSYWKIAKYEEKGADKSRNVALKAREGVEIPISNELAKKIF